jgi:hypothetical protein
MLCPHLGKRHNRVLSITKSRRMRDRDLPPPAAIPTAPGEKSVVKNDA